MLDEHQVMLSPEDDQDLSTDTDTTSSSSLNTSKSSTDLSLAVIIQSFIDYFEEVLAAIIAAHGMEMTPDLITFIISTCL